MCKVNRKDDNKWRKEFGITLKGVFNIYSLDYHVFCKRYHCSDATFRYWLSGNRFPQLQYVENLKEFFYQEIVDSHDKRIKFHSIVGEFMSTQGAEEQFFHYKRLYPDTRVFAGEILAYYRNVAKHKIPSKIHFEKIVPHTGKTQAVVFDFDGTLTKQKLNRTTWESIWIKLGYSERECQELHQRYNKKEISHAEWCKITERKFKERNLHKEVVEEIASKIHLLLGVKQTFKELYQGGIKIYIVSGSIDIIIKQVLGSLNKYVEIVQANRFKFDSEGMLTEIVGTKYDFEGKAYFVTQVAEDLNISTRDILFVGNSINDRFVYLSGAKTLCINPSLTDPFNKTVWHNCIQSCNDLQEILKYI